MTPQQAEYCDNLSSGNIGIAVKEKLTFNTIDEMLIAKHIYGSVHTNANRVCSAVIAVKIVDDFLFVSRSGDS